jgi:hypothetical protein
MLRSTEEVKQIIALAKPPYNVVLADCRNRHSPRGGVCAEYRPRRSSEPNHRRSEQSIRETHHPEQVAAASGILSFTPVCAGASAAGDRQGD